MASPDAGEREAGFTLGASPRALVLENAILTKLTATGALPAGTFVSGAGAVASDANDYLIYNTTTGTLSYDADENGAGAAVAFVTLLGSPALTAADFTIT